MYCIIVTGIPASGKSTFAHVLSERLSIPVISKDRIKELMFDDIGFSSRTEKVKLGVASMNIMYYLAENLMTCNIPFILENNFEFISKDRIESILKKHSCPAVTVTLTGDYEKIYQRFATRDKNPDRHRGHVVNDCYPEKGSERPVNTIPYEAYVDGIRNRGMDQFHVDGPHIIVDTTDFHKIDMDKIVAEIIAWTKSQHV